MSKTFPCHIDLAHGYWKEHVQPGDCVIDATCGNGHDTLFLAGLVGSSGRVIGLDIQEQALDNTRQQLQKNFYTNTSLYLQSHASFPDEANLRPISLIVYNLGYLPGGNKSFTTQTSSTLASLEAALSLVKDGGIISITCYPGHPEGEIEEGAVAAWMQTLCSRSYSICHHRWINRYKAPSLLILKKILYF